jgi:hypothetical protein
MPTTRVAPLAVRAVWNCWYCGRLNADRVAHLFSAQQPLALVCRSHTLAELEIAYEAAQERFEARPGPASEAERR